MFGGYFEVETPTHDMICDGTTTHYSRELKKMETVPCRTCMDGMPYTYVYRIECDQYHKCVNIEEFSADMSRDKAQSFTLTNLLRDIGEYTCNLCGAEKIYSKINLKFLESKEKEMEN